ncbi:endonuclease/exonuclease/phosphatase family protein [Chitinimonas sp.]|uniref:endonuclease/exonuclease/phosphatase family protein n=1 Tax=Chitinimonas sp. TaxID=1934313 RepID=UPI0035B0F1ED
MSVLRISTYNIHKGMSPLNRHHVLHQLKQAVQGLRADLLFLQEVQGEHTRRAARHADWPALPQHVFLAPDHHHAYGCNAQYRSGHHGNALLSRFPISRIHNEDISVNRLERRGLLHGAIVVNGWPQALHCLCVHLNLRAADRRKQLLVLSDYVRQNVPDDAPLIIAGDFNDWRGDACELLGQQLGMQEVFTSLHGRTVASFPARLPLLALDRIYLRGLVARTAEVHGGRQWQGLSDHLPLSATVQLQ